MYKFSFWCELRKGQHHYWHPDVQLVEYYSQIFIAETPHNTYALIAYRYGELYLSNPTIPPEIIFSEYPTLAKAQEVAEMIIHSGGLSE